MDIVPLEHIDIGVVTDHSVQPRPTAVITLTHKASGLTVVGRPTPRFCTAHWQERARLHEEISRAVAALPKGNP